MLNTLNKRETNTKYDLCPLETALSILGGKWKAYIIWEIHEGKKRPIDLLSAIPNINKKVLNDQLKKLVETNVLEKKRNTTSPPSTEYTLSLFGKKIVSTLWDLHFWGEEYLENNTKK